MDGNSEVQGKRKGLRRKRGRRAPHPHVHPVELRRKAVQLCVEEGFPVEQVARDLRVGLSTLGKWVRKYRTQGEAGLQPAPARPYRQRPQVAQAVKALWIIPVSFYPWHPAYGVAFRGSRQAG